MQFDEHGLLPVVAQDQLTGEVRMVAFANERAVALTLETGRATFWSRSRGELWEKGRTSGNGLPVLAVLADCDEDALVYLVAPEGPTCHTGQPSCFFRRARLEDGRIAVHDERVPAPTLLGRLATAPAPAPAAAGGARDDALVNASADALHDLIVALRSRGVPFERVLRELDRRARAGLLDEKRSPDAAG
jgi:phosphoribosyl-AMP cyclohydrolase / phosphoribosyl-ATP pyrophosphohydrolase